MPVDPKFEVPLRKMLGHATRNELQELAALAAAEGDEMYLTGLKLCVPICGYIVVEAAGRWPLESDRRAAARQAVKSPAGLPLAEHDVYAFLSRAVFGFEAIDAVFTKTEKIVQVPMFTTASLLLAYRPEDLDWSGYLDRVWGAFDATEQASVEVLPALTYRVKAGAARARQTAQQTAG